MNDYQGNHLAQSLAKASLGREDAPFIYHLNGKTLSYGRFLANAERMAAALTDAGLKPGDRVAVQAAKTVTMLELYVGTLLAGGIFLPLNPAYTTDEVSYFLNNAAPHILVCDPARADDLAPLARSAGTGQIWTLGADGTGSLTDRRDAHAPGFQAVPRGPEDLAAILYTSGTTGRSKGAMLSHRALESNSQTLRELWRFTANDVLIHALPIFHTHGLFVATNITMMAGGSLIFLPKFDADTIIREMPRATTMMGVPTFYTRLLEQPGLAQAARNMRLFISGSAPLLDETHRRWQAVTGHAILERYGMTETNMTTSNPHDGERRPGTVGFALPGVEIRVCDDNGVELPQGEIGVLEVRGPNLFSGYWKMPEKTAEEMRDDGFFITGDVARIDGDGYLQIVGRAKDLIISGGLNVYPKEVESLIDAIDGVLESAVIGVPHPDLGEAVVAVVVPERGATLDAAQILAPLEKPLARFKQPKKVIFVDELPRNTMGKVQKNALRQQYTALFG
ncbi:MAG: malonyl-CoA synthase [Paracoccaceae bacterium]|nr:malonyl-CoA synthase [Paracoccaceae bacterium]